MYLIIENDTNRIVGTHEANDMNNQPDFIKNECHLVDVNDFLSGCETENEKINKILTAGQVNHNHYPSGYNGYEIEIIWGDWKRDHRWCDSLMESVGYKLISEEVTEENDSDCYSAIRTYEKK